MAKDLLQSLPRETLIRLREGTLSIGRLSTACGLPALSLPSVSGDAAVELDLRNWKKQAITEASWLKEALGLREGGITSILRYQDTNREA